MSSTATSDATDPAAAGSAEAPEATPPFLVIAGPTAVGKSSVAVALAERLGGEIVLGDARQVYAGLDIGTARPTPAERARVRHHLLDRVPLGTAWSAADFARAARAAIVDIARRGRVPIVCGGTGFYLAALAGRLDPIGGPSDEPRDTMAGDAGRAAPDEAARDEAGRRVADIPLAARHAALEAVDSEAAARIHPHDRQRVTRALAVYFQTGRPLSAWQRGGGPAAPRGAICLTRPRAELVARITARVDAMLAAGLETEARALWTADWTPDAPGLDTIGYREWWPYFAGGGTAADVRERILTATRRYAKRQMTWFRRQGAYRLVPAERGVVAGCAAWEALR